MSFQHFFQSIYAFNQNAINNIIYNFMNNWWLIFLVIGAAATSVMGAKEQSAGIVHDEQNIL